MENYKILTKVNYSHNQNNACVLLKQFLIAESNGQKILILKMKNNFSQRLNCVKYKIYQLNDKGAEVKTFDFVYDNFQVSPSTVFVPYKSIVLDKQCVDIKVELTQAVFENYTFDASEEKVEETVNKKTEKTNKMQNDFLVTERKPKAPKLITVFSTLFFVGLAVATYFTIEQYKNTHLEFSINDFEYRFLDQTFSEKGDIILTKYNGRAKNIKIPDKVLEHTIIGIDDMAFMNTSIENIVIETEYEQFTIGEQAFKDCEKLKTITLGTTIEIGAEAFSNCSELNEISSQYLTKIGSEAFRGSGIEYLKLDGSTNLSLGANVFDSCLNLKEVEINQFIEFDNQNFSFLSNCTNVESLSLLNNSLNAKSKSYSISDMFNNSNHSLKNLSIDTVNSISDNFCKDLPIEKIVIKNLNSGIIGDYAFNNCYALTSLSLPTDITEIGRYAFANSGISKIDLDKVKSIEEYAFLGCRIKAASLPKEITSLPSGVFANCEMLKKITIEGSLLEVSDNLFKNCYALESIVMDNKRIESIGENAFSGCQSLRSFQIGDNVIFIGANAFSGCSSLQSINIPSYINLIDTSTFANCTSLKKVIIDSNSKLQEIGKYAFANCSSLENIDLNQYDSLDSIGDYAFSGCASLKSIDMPKSIELGLLSEGIFENCYNLESFVLPENIYIIGAKSFANCSNLSSFSFENNNTLFDIQARAFQNCVSLKNVSIPNTLSVLGQNVFEGCNNIVNLSIPFAAYEANSTSSMAYLFGSTNGNDSLRRVNLFSACNLSSNAFKNFNSLQTIILSDDLVSIGDNAFEGCYSLQSLVIGENVEFIGNSILKDCTSLEELEIPFIGNDINSAVSLRELYSLNSFGHSENSTLKSIKITKAVSLADYVFENFTALSNIELPETLKSIGAYAFKNCTSIENIVIPNSVDTLNTHILEGCSSIKEITIPFIGFSINSGAQMDYVFGYNSVRKLDRIELTKQEVLFNSTFSNWEIKEIILPETLTSIMSYAFERITGLKSLVIPTSVENMQNSILYGCYDLESLSIPFIGESRSFTTQLSNLFDWDLSKYSLKHLEITDATILCSNVFNGWNKIQSISLNNGITEIPYGAFQSCYSLYDITIPESVLRIGSYAFNSCYNLNEITIPENVITINSYAFSECKSLYSVINKSQLNIVPGDYDNGQVAYYAYEVLSENEQTSLQYNQIDDFKFVYVNNQWKLIKYFGEEKTLTFIDSFEYNGQQVNHYSINQYLLMGRNGIESIFIPASVTSIGEAAFYDIDSLTEVSFDENSQLKQIPNSLFYHNEQLISVNLPSSVEVIDNYAFAYCTSLTSFVVTENVKNIYYGAFENCTNLLDVLNLTSLKIEKGSSDFGAIAHNAIIVRTSIDQSPIKYIEIDDFKYAYSDDVLVLLKYNKLSHNQSVVLPISVEIEGVTYDKYELHSNVFYNTYISSIHIPSSVTKIGNYCFANCYNLLSITFDEDIQLESIGDYAFSSCSSVQQLTNISTLKKIGNYAFAWCNSLQEVSLPSNLEYIGNNAFVSCSSLRKIVLPETLSTIEYSAFYDCVKLYEVVNLSKNLDIEKGSSDYGYVAYYAKVVNTSTSQPGVEYVTIGDFEFLHFEDETVLVAYKNTKWVSELTLPESININGKEINEYKIGQNVFRYQSFQKINIPSSVIEIERNAFESCNALKEVVIAEDSKITSIGENAFNYCSSLESFILPSSVKNIKSYAFSYCYSLVDLVVGENVETIELDAFYNCKSLINVYNYSSLDIKINSTSYGQVAKYAMNIYGKDVEYVKSNVVNENGNIFVLVGEDWYLLSNIYYVNQLILPSEFYFNGTRIKEYIIGKEIMLESYLLQEVIIPTSVKGIMSGAFANCNYLSSVYYLGDKQQWDSLEINDKNILSKDIYFYSDCIHYERQWKYDDYGGILLNPSYIEWTIIKSPSCTAEGEAEGYCSQCNKNVVKPLDKIEHNYVDDKCSICGAQFIIVSKDNFADVFINDSDYPYNISASSLISSTLNDDSKSATLTYVAQVNTTVSFDYRVSSEQSCDKLLIYITDGSTETLVLEESGEVSYTSVQYHLLAGQSLKIVYSKDGSVSSGLDRIYLRNFIIM